MGPRSITLTYAGDANSKGSQGSTSYTVQSNVPVVNSPASATGLVGQSFTYTISASGAGPFSYVAQPLPDGLTLNGSVISGTPATAGNTNVVVTATNPSGTSAPFTLAITINGAYAPTITSTLQASGTVTSSFTYTITATGTNPIVFNATNLPDGLSFSGNAITGMPTGIGTSQITLTATNNVGMDSKILTLTVTLAGAPVITSPDFINVRAGAPFSYTITATGPGAITYGASNLPTGLTLTGDTITGTAPSVGNYPATITASNSAGTVAQGLLIGVFPDPSTAPQIISINVSRNPVRTNTDVMFSADILVPSGLPITETWTYFSSLTTPDGVVLSGDPVTRQYANPGTFYVLLSATDGFNDAAKSDKIVVTLLDPNPGTSAPNIFNDGGSQPNSVNNQSADPLGIAVSDSLGGVLNFDGLPNGATTAARVAASETFAYSINGNAVVTNPGGNQFIAGKFTTPSINVVQLLATPTAGGAPRKARIMVPVSAPETGASTAVTDTRTVKGAATYKVTGKFLGAKPSSLTFTATIQLPAGLPIADFATMQFGISNLHSTFTLNAKGAVISNSDAVHFTKPKFKLPKFNKKDGGKTEGNTMLSVSFTMVGMDLVSGGFDTDGIVHVQGTTAVPRQLQFAAVVSGMTYVGTLDGMLTPPKSPTSTDFGTFQARR